MRFASHSARRRGNAAGSAARSRVQVLTSLPEQVEIVAPMPRVTRFVCLVTDRSCGGDPCVPERDAAISVRSRVVAPLQVTSTKSLIQGARPRPGTGSCSPTWHNHRPGRWSGSADPRCRRHRAPRSAGSPSSAPRWRSCPPTSESRRPTCSPRPGVRRPPVRQRAGTPGIGHAADATGRLQAPVPLTA